MKKLLEKNVMLFDKTVVKISRGADNPLCLSIAIEGGIGGGVSLVYRLGPKGGNRQDVIEMVELILEALKHAPRAQRGRQRAT